MNLISKEMRDKKAIRDAVSIIETELGDIKEASIKAMGELVRGNGSITSYSAFGKLCGLSRQILHKYELGAALPTINHAVLILALCDSISRIKAMWEIFIRTWEERFSMNILNSIVYPPAVLAIIKSDYPIKEKIEKLTRFSLKELVEQMEE